MARAKQDIAAIMCLQERVQKPSRQSNTNKQQHEIHRYGTSMLYVMSLLLLFIYDTKSHP